MKQMGTTWFGTDNRTARTLASRSEPRVPSLPSGGVSKGFIIASALLLFATLIVTCIMMSPRMPLAIFVPLLVLLGLCAVIVVLMAAAGSLPALTTYFVLLLFLTNGNFRVRPEGDMSLDWQGLLKFALWLGAGVIGFPYLQDVGKLLRQPGAALWLAYFGIALLSVFLAPSPAFSIGYLLSLFCIFIFMIAVVDRLSEVQILKTTTFTLAVFLLAGWVAVYLDPELGEFKDLTPHGFEMRINGISGQANNLGLVCAVNVGTVFLLVWKRYMRVISALPFAILGVITLSATDSRTSLAGAAASVLAVIVFRSRMAIVGLALTATIGGVALISLPQTLEMLGQAVSRSGDADETLTLTGRTQIWDFTWEKILESPIVGWGYNSSKTIIAEHIGFANGLVVDSAHNLLLQNLLSVGFLGTIPLTGLLLKLVIDVARGRGTPIGVLFLVMVFVTGFTDPSAVGTTPSVLTIMFILGSIWSEAPSKPFSHGGLRRPPIAPRRMEVL